MPLRPPWYWQQMLRRRRISLALAAGLILLALVWADRRWPVRETTDDYHRYHGRTFRVVHVVDGDTLDIDAPDRDRKTTRVRLWGIDTPEIAHPAFGQMENQPFGLEAKELTRQLAEGQMVRLELESHRVRDVFGRLLAHVFLPDGRCLNEELLIQGLARADRRPGDARFVHSRMSRYELLEQQARLQRRGIWSVAERPRRR